MDVVLSAGGDQRAYQIMHAIADGRFANPHPAIRIPQLALP
jgi:hypothetical protein